LLNFGTRFSNFCFLDNHEYDFSKSYECLAGIGAISSIVSSKEKHLQQLKEFQKENRDWIFGHVAYDLKNEIEDLVSENVDEMAFPDFVFFVPEIVFILSNDAVLIGVCDDNDATRIFNEISEISFEQKAVQKLNLQSRFSKNEYVETVKKIQEHIARGDCYEICFCQEFFGKNISIDPVGVFRKLDDLSPNPFSAFYKCEEKYLMCASPERFLKKTKNQIISQPMKGTSKRMSDNNVKDEEEKKAMELIEKFERTKRGLFSGTVGYINPDGDFDFNVVIRSILYNNENKYLSIQAGSAITFKSIAEKEFEECHIKIEAMKKALE
jgi:para-aminobenzoate synthetase component 1